MKREYVVNEIFSDRAKVLRSGQRGAGLALVGFADTNAENIKPMTICLGGMGHA